MQKLFLSYSSKDREFVRALQQALALSGEDVWVDFHELAGGDALWEEIQAAIESSAHYAIVVSANSLASKWVGKELQHALQVKEKRAAFRVIPISLDGATLGALEAFLGYEPKYVPPAAAPAARRQRSTPSSWHSTGASPPTRRHSRSRSPSRSKSSSSSSLT